MVVGGGGGMGAPSFSGRGVLSAFSRFNQRGRGVGGGGGGAFCAFGRFNQWGEGAVRFQPIQPVVDAHVCKLLLRGGGGGGAPFSPEEGGHGPPLETPMGGGG